MYKFESKLFGTSIEINDLGVLLKILSYDRGYIIDDYVMKSLLEKGFFEGYIWVENGIEGIDYIRMYSIQQ